MKAHTTCHCRQERKKQTEECWEIKKERDGERLIEGGKEKERVREREKGSGGEKEC